ITMVVQELLKILFRYNSPKYISTKDARCVFLKWLCYLAFAAFVCVVASTYRYSEETDEGNSVVRTNVKGVSNSNNRTWDTAEYMQMQAINSFFVMTNIIQTANQVEEECPEYPSEEFVCSSDEFCEKGRVDVFSNGVQTGRCVTYNETVKTCEVKAWCPVQSTKSPPEPAVLRSSENFTVLIKNNIYFPTFNCALTNMPLHLNTSCKYNKKTSPLCPIFRLGDILQEAKENFSEMAITGGIIAIEINWDCYLKSCSHNCNPTYGFRRLDDKNDSGFSFRSSRYYKLPNGTEQRTLYKVYGIRFDVHVFSIGRRWNFIKLIKNIGSIISYLGLTAGITEFFILLCSNCQSSTSSLYKIYQRKKYDDMLDPSQVMCVSFVDEPHVTLIKKPLKKSLQHARGDIIESHPTRFYDVASFFHSKSNRSPDNEVSEPTCTSESNGSHDSEEHKLRPPSRQETPDCQEWCCCGKCQPSQEYQEQLCCRKKKGECITTTDCFQQLLLSRDTMESALRYANPFENLSDANIDTQLCHLAYKEYIHWRFGSFDLQDSAIIPSCCKWKIKDNY
ncbi:P2RX7 protein, partial [Chloroceryle aenea]|nr:P2RX7 protein [Chloroceryle aenea]